MAYCDKKKSISFLGLEKGYFLSILGHMWRTPRYGQKWPKNAQNVVKIENFQIFPNGPKWIKVASKWSKMAPKPIFVPFGHVFVPFWPVPPSLWGVSPTGWAGLGPPSGWEAPSYNAYSSDAPGWPQCCSNGFYSVQGIKTGTCGAHTLA